MQYTFFESFRTCEGSLGALRSNYHCWERKHTNRLSGDYFDKLLVFKIWSPNRKPNSSIFLASQLGKVPFESIFKQWSKSSKPHLWGNKCATKKTSGQKLPFYLTKGTRLLLMNAKISVGLSSLVPLMKTRQFWYGHDRPTKELIFHK